jgi:rhomboid protease GluP
MGFVPLVLWACGALFLATLAADPSGIRMEVSLAFLAPSVESLQRFGASGARPVFGYGRWWTVLSAAWLHGGILHIVFNMMWVRDLAPATAHLYGAARAVIIYTVAAVTGFLASSVAGLAPYYFPDMPSVLRGAGTTVGASAPIFGLIGALLYYGRRGGSAHLSQQAKSMAVGMLILGFAIPAVDNWAHLGGLAGGYVTGRVLDPLTPERGDHVTLALLCLALSAASVATSVITGLPGR